MLKKTASTRRACAVGAFGVLLLSILVLAGCSGPDSDKKTKTTAERPLLIFCGITMIDPVKELMVLYEKESGVKSTMSYGGSADLLQSLMLNKVGDVYFPGAESFIQEAEKAGVLGEKRRVGVNQAALFVKKGNPKGFSGELDELYAPGVQAAIGHPDLGSVGKEAKTILQAKGVYDQVVKASAMMQPDSKALSTALKAGQVDVVLNWKAVQYVGDNADHMDAIPIKGGFAKPHTLTMAATIYSQNPQTTRAFLDLCASPRGLAVFARHGFGDESAQ